MSSVGLELETWVEKGLLRFHSSRPTLTGLEMHLAIMHRVIDVFDPSLVVVDPVSNLTAAGTLPEVKSMLMRLVDFLKGKQVTAILTDLTSASRAPEETEAGLSSLMDTWILLRNLETNGQRNRGLYVLKARGMGHSNQIRELAITGEGIRLMDVDAGGVLRGSAPPGRGKASPVHRQEETKGKQPGLQTRRQAMEAKIAALRASFEAQEDELRRAVAQAAELERVLNSGSPRRLGHRKKGSSDDGRAEKRDL
jgi:circadian clock protein KaiC